MHGMTSFGLTSKVIAVTGAAGGVGAAIARTIADAGATVVGLDLVAEHADARVRAHALDVTSAADWADAAAAIEAEFGTCHGLVNNAGITMRRRLDEVTMDEWHRTMEINATGPLLGMQALLPLMPPGASIVNIASIAALTGHFAVPYTASKWALRGLTRAASLELGPRGIRVNAVMPGLMATAMTADVHESVAAALLGEVPLGSPATVADVAAVVHFLLSDASSHLSGVEIPVDGGQVSQGGMKSVSDAVRAAAAT